MTDVGSDYFERPFYFHPQELKNLRDKAEPVIDLGTTYYSTYYSSSSSSNRPPPPTPPTQQLMRPSTPPQNCSPIILKHDFHVTIDSIEEQMINDSIKKEGGFNQLFSMATTPIKKEPLLENNVDDDNAFDKEEIFLLSPHCKEYSLFQYFDEMTKTGCSNMVLSFKEVYKTCYYKLIELVDELDETSITQLITNFVDTLLLQLITLDKKGVKVLEIVNKFHELYISSTKNNMGKNDYTRYDYINQLTYETFKQACDIKSDTIYLSYSQTKQRGRRREEDKLETPNPVNAIRINSISAAVPDVSTSTVSSSSSSMAVTTSTNTSHHHEDDELVGVQKKRITKGNKERKKRELIYHPPNDEYKVFLKTMKLINDNLPRETNYGGYQKELRQWIRDYETTLLIRENKSSSSSSSSTPPPIWPLWRLLRVICNMQYMTDVKLRKNFRTKGSVYYCDYSGELIKDGDDIYILEIYENDIVRFIKWDINKTRPNREFESDELLKSNRMFLVKKTQCSPVSLFPTSFSSHYKTQHQSFFFKPKGDDDVKKKMVKTTPPPPPPPPSQPIQILQTYRLSITMKDENVWMGLDRLKDQNRTLLSSMCYKLEDVTMETFTNDIVGLVHDFYSEKDESPSNPKNTQVVKSMMDFIDYLLPQEDDNNGNDVLSHHDTIQVFSSMINNVVFKGRDTLILNQSSKCQIRLKNSIILRGFLYMTYKRRSQSLQYGKKREEITKLNYFHAFSSIGVPIYDSEQFHYSKHVLIALFDYLFRIVY